MDKLSLSKQCRLGENIFTKGCNLSTTSTLRVFVDVCVCVCAGGREGFNDVRGSQVQVNYKN